ncbi:MBL fold metallo-hydrolase [Chloroflexota bacterium]
MDIQITTLSENTASSGYIAEWGLSVLVEADGLRILVDTGRSFTMVYNAQLMGIDLATIHGIMLSHGHVDHTGGLRGVLQRRGEVEVIAHPDIWVPKFVRFGKEPEEHYCGIPFLRTELESLGARFNLSSEPVRISEHVLTTGEVPMVTEYEAVEQNLLVEKDGQLQPDPMTDDRALIIDAEYGLVVILGCAHRGIVNTLRHAQSITGREQIHTVIGGTHLVRASKERLDSTVADLREMGVQRLGVSHCTGFPASARLAAEFGDSFFLNNAGTRLTLP